MSLPAPGTLDDDIQAADLGRLASRSRESEALGHLCAAVSAYSGSSGVSPFTAEIDAGIAAAILATILIERSSLTGNAARQLRNQPARGDVAAAVHAWRNPTERGRAQLADGPNISPARTSAPPANGQVCTLFTVDIAGFTRPDRDDDIRLYLHEALYEILRKAFDGSGIPWADCFCEDRGDGALIVVPPDVACKGISDLLPERLRSLIRRHNHVSSQAAGIQLRAAAHVGLVEHDGHGFVGSDINLLFRMLEARPLKRVLARSGAELALIVSDYMYRSLICRYPSLVSPNAFRAVRFQVKHTRTVAWTYLPGASLEDPSDSSQRISTSGEHQELAHGGLALGFSDLAPLRVRPCVASEPAAGDPARIRSSRGRPVTNMGTVELRGTP